MHISEVLICPKCGKINPVEAEFCDCGYHFVQNSEPPEPLCCTPDVFSNISVHDKCAAMISSGKRRSSSEIFFTIRFLLVGYLLLGFLFAWLAWSHDIFIKPIDVRWIYASIILVASVFLILSRKSLASLNPRGIAMVFFYLLYIIFFSAFLIFSAYCFIRYDDFKCGKNALIRALYLIIGILVFIGFLILFRQL